MPEADEPVPQSASVATWPLQASTGLAAKAANVTLMRVELSPLYGPVLVYSEPGVPTPVMTPLNSVKSPAACVPVQPAPAGMFGSAGIGNVPDTAGMHPLTPWHGSTVS